jgi:hypothetical protein
MSLAFDGLNLNSNELKEFTYGFFANMCSMIGGEEFSKYLKTVVGLMLESIQIAETENKPKPEFLKKKKIENNENNFEIKNEEEKFDENKIINLENEDDEEDDDDSEDEDENGGVKSVRESVIDEKTAAIEALGVIAEVSQYFINNIEIIFIHICKIPLK